MADNVFLIGKDTIAIAVFGSDGIQGCEIEGKIDQCSSCSMVKHCPQHEY